MAIVDDTLEAPHPDEEVIGGGSRTAAPPVVDTGDTTWGDYPARAFMGGLHDNNRRGRTAYILKHRAGAVHQTIRSGGGGRRAQGGSRQPGGANPPRQPRRRWMRRGYQSRPSAASGPRRIGLGIASQAAPTIAMAAPAMAAGPLGPVAVAGAGALSGAIVKRRRGRERPRRPGRLARGHRPDRYRMEERAHRRGGQRAGTDYRIGGPWSDDRRRREDGHENRSYGTY